MARCAGCGSENIPDARFCKQCGKALEADAAPADDEGPITVVPGEPVATTGTPASHGRTGLIVGLVLTGLAAAAAIGYVIGTRSTAVETTKAIEPAPAAAASSRPAEAAVVAVPAATEQSARKPAEKAPPRKAEPAEAAHAKQAPQPSPAAVPAPTSDPGEQQWARMRTELAACGKANLICHEKVRWRYCKHMWGKVPDCPQASANAPSN